VGSVADANVECVSIQRYNGFFSTTKSLWLVGRDLITTREKRKKKRVRERERERERERKFFVVINGH
jgi:hypothetical protein